MGSVRLSPLAQADIAETYTYGARRWGRPQADAYDTDLRSSASTAARFPRIGRKHETERGVELKRYSSGRHVTFYVIETDHILIVRILHGSMDFDRHLD